MLISIFIPTGNRADSLERVLKSLTKQTFKNFEVLIVDYKSTDKTPEVIASYSKKLHIRVIHQKIKGLAKAANLALKHAKGDIFIRTDDDVIMSQGWAKAISETFSSDTMTGGVTGPTVIPKEYFKNRDLFTFEEKFRKGSMFWKILGKIYYGYFMEHDPYRVSCWFKSGAFGLGSNFPSSEKENIHEVTNLEACNFSVRKKLLKKSGGFDENYGGVGEYHEPDAAFKIKELGYKLIFNPKVYLNHCPSQEGFFKERPESYSRMVNFVVFYLRHIKMNTLDKCIRFTSYLIFLDCYYLYIALKTRQFSQLGAMPGTIAGFFQFFKTRTT